MRKFSEFVIDTLARYDVIDVVLELPEWWNRHVSPEERLENAIGDSTCNQTMNSISGTNSSKPLGKQVY